MFLQFLDKNLGILSKFSMLMAPKSDKLPLRMNPWHLANPFLGGDAPINVSSWAHVFGEAYKIKWFDEYKMSFFIPCQKMALEFLSGAFYQEIIHSA